MTGSQVFKATLPELPSEPARVDKTELARLREFERSVAKMVKMLRSDYWDESEKDGVAGDLHSEINRLWIDMEGIGKKLRRNQEDTAQRV